VGLDGGLADEQAARDVGVGLAVGDEGENIGFACGQPIWRLAGLARCGFDDSPESVEQSGLHGGVEQRLACLYSFDRAGDFLGSGVLGEVAAGAGAQRREHRFVVAVGGEHDDLYLGQGRADAAGCLDPVDAGHPQVHQHHVGAVLGGQGHSVLAVLRGGDQLDAGQLTKH